MPYLTLEERASLLRPLWDCRRCHQPLMRNYCRQCDEFFFTCGCLHENPHAEHRVYLGTPHSP